MPPPSPNHLPRRPPPAQRGGLRVIREGERETGAQTEKAHMWRPIEDIPAQFDEKARAAEEELRGLSASLQKRRAEMSPDERETFNRELNREWAIETGLIEFAYHLERGTTRLLIERGFEETLIPRHNGQDPAEVVLMLRDHESVVNALFDFVAGNRELSTGYVKEMHAEMLRNQKMVVGVDQFGGRKLIPMNHGVFKMRPNNPHTPDGKLHEYCPWEQTASEMDRLIAMHKTHSARSPLAQAAWLHHRFVQIHPFEDGNGRIARCLASLVFIRAKWFPLVIPLEERNDYLDTLQAADRGDLSPLICALAKWQKRFYLRISGVEQVMQAKAKMEEMRGVPSDSAGNVLVKIGMARELLLLGDEFMRSQNGKFLSERRAVNDDIAQLENVRRIVEELNGDSPTQTARQKILSECGELATSMADKGMDRILLCHRG